MFPASIYAPPLACFEQAPSTSTAASSVSRHSTAEARYRATGAQQRDHHLFHPHIKRTTHSTVRPSTAALPSAAAAAPPSTNAAAAHNRHQPPVEARLIQFGAQAAARKHSARALKRAQERAAIASLPFAPELSELARAMAPQHDAARGSVEDQLLRWGEDRAVRLAAMQAAARAEEVAAMRTTPAIDAVSSFIANERQRQAMTASYLGNDTITSGASTGTGTGGAVRSPSPLTHVELRARHTDIGHALHALHTEREVARAQRALELHTTEVPAMPVINARSRALATHRDQYVLSSVSSAPSSPRSQMQSAASHQQQHRHHQPQHYTTSMSMSSLFTPTAAATSSSSSSNLGSSSTASVEDRLMRAGAEAEIRLLAERARHREAEAAIMGMYVRL